MSLVNTSDIIQKFELFIGDSTELSTTEEVDLAQKIYNKILDSDEWEFLKKEATGTISGTEITQPADFKQLTSAQRIYIGTNRKEFIQVPFERRREFANQNGFFYYDARQEKFIFTVSQSDTYSFDYVYVPEALDTTTSNPVFPVRFWDMVYHGMCVDSDIINLSDKARSYAQLNESKYASILANMQSWNKKISGYNTY
jgi:hypothetical protein